MGWTRLALRRLRDDRAATLGLALLVLVTAFLAALAPRVIAGLADSAVRAEVGIRDGLGAEHRAAPGPGHRRGPGRVTRSRSSARPGSSTSRRSRPRCGRSIASRSAVIESGRFRVEPADDGSRVRQAPDPGGRRCRRDLRRGPAANRRRDDAGRRRTGAGRWRAGVRGRRLARDGGGVRADARPDRAAHGRPGRSADRTGPGGAATRSRP